MPFIGETILGNEFNIFVGGKGCNQAVAAHRLDQTVFLVGSVGKDAFGELALQALKSEQMPTDYVLQMDEVGTGVASILVDDSGDNCIVVVPRANHALTPDHIDRVQDLIAAADVLLLQMEVPVETSKRAAELAHAHKVTVVMNMAPAAPVDSAFLSLIDVLVVNATEAVTMASMLARPSPPADASEAARSLLHLGPKCVVVTTGADGSYAATSDVDLHVPAFKVDVVDTTAAGDAFCAALASRASAFTSGDEPLHPNELTLALVFANASGALTTTKRGALPSLPSLADVAKLAHTHPLIARRRSSTGLPFNPERHERLECQLESTDEATE